MTTQPWITIVGIVIVIGGLAISTYGAILIYRADRPRNDWILEALWEGASKPSGAVFSDGPSLGEVRWRASQRVEEVSEQARRFDRTSKRGMVWIFSGFLVQVAGNVLFIAAYFMTGFS